ELRDGGISPAGVRVACRLSSRRRLHGVRQSDDRRVHRRSDEGRRGGGLRRDRPRKLAGAGTDRRAEAHRIDGPLAPVAVDDLATPRSGYETRVLVTLGPTRRIPDGLGLL